MRKNHSKIVCIKLVHLPYLDMAILTEKFFKTFILPMYKKISTYAEVYWNKLERLQNCSLSLDALKLTVTALFITDMWIK